MTMTEPGFPVRVTRGVPVVIAPEEIDITNAATLRAALLHAAARPGPALVVDMTRTRFCDSAGLHALIGAHKRARADGGGLVLAIGGKAVLHLFEITGAVSAVPCFASLEEALTHASSNGRQADGVAGDGGGQAPQGSAASGRPGADAR